ncbi:MAG: autotransporter-associated beta strand repeat-containing protein, partial [Methylococcaceae bacterium]
MNKLCYEIIVLSIVCSLSMPAFAQGSIDGIWNVDANGSWVDAANWQGGDVPGLAAPGTTSPGTATFSKTLTDHRAVTVDSGRNIGNIVFNNTSAFGYTLQTGALALTNGGTIQSLSTNGGHIDTVSSDIALQGNNGTAAFTSNATSEFSVMHISGGVTGVSTSGNTTTLTLNGANAGNNGDVNPSSNEISGVIGNGAGGGKLAVTKDGTGSWVLSNANTYTGETKINTGELTVRGAGTLGNGAGGVTVNSGAALMLGEFGGSPIEDVANAITVAGTGTTGLGAIINLGGNNNISGTITQTGDTTINSVSNQLTLSGDINGTHNLRLEGAWEIAVKGVIGTGTGSVTKVGSGVLFLEGANTYTGGTNINYGPLVVRNNSALGTGNVSISDGGLNGELVLDVTGLTIANNITSVKGAGFRPGEGAIVNWSGDNTISGSITQTGDTTIFSNAGVLTLGGDINGAHSLTLAGDGDTAISSVLSTITGLTKNGDGMLTLSGANTYTGSTTISAGILSANTLNNGGDAGSIGAAGNAAANLVLDGGTLRYTGNSASTDRAFTITDGKTGTIDVSSADSNLTMSGTSAATTGSLNKTGLGELTLSSANNYTGGTTISTGQLTVEDSAALGTGAVTINNGATLMLGQNGSNTVTNVINVAGKGVNEIGAINSITMADSNTLSGTINLTGDTTIGSIHNVLNLTGNITGNHNLEMGGEGNINMDGGMGIGTGALTKTGSGALYLSGANNYSGGTNINFGYVAVQNSGALGTGAVAIGSDTFNGVLALESETGIVVANNIASVKGAGFLPGEGAIYNLSGNNTLSGTITQTGDTTIVSKSDRLTLSGKINGAHNLTVAGAGDTLISGNLATISGLTKNGDGLLTLSGINTYNGGTTISEGAVRVGNGSALGSGAVNNNAILDIGSTTLNIGGGAYTQGASAASTLRVAVNGATNGSIVSTGLATVHAADSLVLNVSNYVANNATYKIIQGGAGGAIAAPGITVTGNNRATFAATTIGDELILTSNRTANGFASNANPGDANARAVGNVLDNITNPSTDMSNVLNTLEGLSQSQTAAALDTLVPEVDAGVINNDRAMLNNFTGVSIDRVEKAHTEGQSKRSSRSGISGGEAGKMDGLWARGYGSYLTQGTRGGIAGYNAWNAGTALGVDRRFTDALTLGISGGYAYGNVNSDANGANTTI